MISVIGCSPKGIDTEIEVISESTLISKALEQGKLAVVNNELDIAENSFNLILNENSDHEEAKEWLELIGISVGIKEKMKENKLEEAQLLYQELQSNRYRAVMKSNLDELRKYLQQNPEYGKYTNAEYGFSFDYPGEWIDRIDIREGNLEGFTDAIVSFFYVNKDKEIDEFVFNVNILDEFIAESEYESGYGKYLSSGGNRTYESIFIGDPSEDLQRPENEADLNFIGNMIGDVEYNVIVDSFQIEKQGAENAKVTEKEEVNSILATSEGLTIEEKLVNKARAYFDSNGGDSAYLKLYPPTWDVIYNKEYYAMPFGDGSRVTTIYGDSEGGIFMEGLGEEMIDLEVD